MFRYGMFSSDVPTRYSITLERTGLRGSVNTP
jgi:hypothetical protein